MEDERLNLEHVIGMKRFLVTVHAIGTVSGCLGFFPWVVVYVEAIITGLVFPHDDSDPLRRAAFIVRDG
jgi:hypothetical protein